MKTVWIAYGGLAKVEYRWIRRKLELEFHASSMRELAVNDLLTFQHAFAHGLRENDLRPVLIDRGLLRRHNAEGSHMADNFRAHS